MARPLVVAVDYRSEVEVGVDWGRLGYKGLVLGVTKKKKISFSQVLV